MDDEDSDIFFSYDDDENNNNGLNKKGGGDEEDINNNNHDDEDDGLDVDKDEEADGEDQPPDEQQRNYDENYYHHSEQQQQQDTAVTTGVVASRKRSAAVLRRTKKKLPLQSSKLEKLVKSSREWAKTASMVHDIARKQFEEERGDPLCRDENNREEGRAARSKKKLEYNTTDINSAIGFDRTDIGGKEEVNTFDSRLKKASEDEVFGIKRRVTMAVNRFMPFGSGDFLTHTVDFYVRKTNLACIWCTEPFETLPIPCPIRYKAATQSHDYYFLVCGQFCSFNCMLADQRKEERSLSVARLMMKMVYNIPMGLHVQDAPSRLSLLKFGGYYSIEQFRATSIANIQIQEVKPPFFPFKAGLSEIEEIKVEITETGGKELATRRLRGAALGTIAPVISQSGDASGSNRRLQQSKFATALTIDEQLALSDRKYRLQRETKEAAEGGAKKRRTLTDFMKPKQLPPAATEAREQEKQ